jgi:hypothetical protein
MNIYFLEIIQGCKKNEREKMRVEDNQDCRCRNITYQNRNTYISIELPQFTGQQIRKVKIIGKRKRGMSMEASSFIKYEGWTKGIYYQFYRDVDIEEVMASRKRVSNLIKRGIIAYYLISN